jgi:hypothetical protein
MTERTPAAENTGVGSDAEAHLHRLACYEAVRERMARGGPGWMPKVPPCIEDSTVGGRDLNDVMRTRAAS